MSIGTNIKGLREERGFTQEQIAEALGVSFQAVSSWERDEYKPDTDRVIKLAEVFDVSVSAILEEKHKAFKTKEAIYNWEHMKTYVKTTAKNLKLKNTLKAVDFAVEAHKGQTRKKSDVPYIYVTRVEERNALRSYLTRRQIYCPVHWPLPASWRSQTAINLSNTLISIPIDQRYWDYEVENVARTVREFFNE